MLNHLASDDFEKYWVCRNCLHEYIPFRNNYTCPKCHSQSTFSTKTDSYIKKSETHTDIVPHDPYPMVSEKKVIEDRDIEGVYERCLSWLHNIDAEIKKEIPPTYLAAIHFPGGVHITARARLEVRFTCIRWDYPKNLNEKVLDIWVFRRYEDE